jgi:hypothetical protein
MIYVILSGVGLCYYEPVTEINENNIESALLDDGFSMPFSAHLLELELEPVGVVKPLLRVVRELWEMNSPPKEREGCGDCKKLEELVGLVEDKRFI